jgi:hypothetical protein
VSLTRVHWVRVILLGSVGFGLVALLAPEKAAADPNFGFKYKDQSCCVLRGTRAGLYPPDNTYPVPSGVLALMRVSAQRVFADVSGLIQIGFGKTNSITFDNCGQRSSLTNYWEYRKFTAGSDYFCAWLDGEPVVLDAPRLYMVLRRASASTGNETTWEAKLDGLRHLSVNILFDGAELILAGGELNNCFSCSGLPDGAMHGWYGASGSTAWQRTSTEGGGNWVTITSATNYNSDGQWAIGNLPGPFVIHHYN